jgi:hypothetical protein
MLLGMKVRLLAVAALLVLAAVVARGESALPLGETRSWFDWWRMPTLTPPGGVAVPQGTESSEPGLWLAIVGWIALMLPVALLVVAVVTAIVVGIRKIRIGPPSPIQPDEESAYPGTDLAAPLLTAVRAARNALVANRGGPPSDAVIAAWLELEAAAADSGHSRAAHQTPTEFTEALDISTDAINTLRGLYQRARFGPPGTVTEADAQRAQAALDDIVLALTTETASR